VINGSTTHDLNESLDSFVSEQINQKVVVDYVLGEIVVPSVMQKYRNDFGGTDEAILKFVYKYLKKPHAVDYETVY
jgi:hypothetical protein